MIRSILTAATSSRPAPVRPPKKLRLWPVPAKPSICSRTFGSGLAKSDHAECRVRSLISGVIADGSALMTTGRRTVNVLVI